jgi:hypothetical protein
MRMSVGGHAVERRAPVTPMTFYGIPDAAGVERLIADTFGASTANVVGDSGLPSNGVGALPAHLGLAPRPAALDRQAATAADEFPPPPYAADR